MSLANKIFTLTLSVFVLMFALSSCSSNEKTTPTTDKNKGEEFSEKDRKALSEATGYTLVENIKALNLNLDLNALIEGIKKAQAGAEAPMSKQDYMELMNQYQEHLTKIKGDQNLQVAESFLEENKGKSGVISQESGKLQYEILTEGSGAEVPEDGAPLINYTGTLVDGTVFDSTEKRGKPISLPLSSTIPGFKKGIVGMKQGEKRRLFIHPDLAYGSRGPLPPNSLLIFEVEIVEAQPKKEEPSAKEEPSVKTEGMKQIQKEVEKPKK